MLSDPAAEWLKIGVPVVLQHDLMTAHTLIPGFAPDEANALQGGATRILRTSIENRQGGLHIETTLVDPATHKVLKVESVDAGSVSVLLPPINTLAKKIDRDAVDFSTRNQQAWQTFSSAQGVTNAQQRFQMLNQAFSQDQSFGAAAIAFLDMIAPNRQADYKIPIDQAKAHRSSFTPIDRAKFDVAINRLSNAPPSDQIQAARQALTLAPNDLEVLTTLGNYQILQGDSAGAEQSLRHAASLNPVNVGLRFELARGLMQLRKYKEADTIFSGINNMPAIYPELATCVLLEGDKTRATGIAEKFVASVQNQEIRPVLRAAWQVMSGDRQKGIDTALNTKFSQPNVHALALGAATMWQLMGGDFSNAKKNLAPLSQAGGPGLELSTLAGLLADNTSSPADWQQKVQSLPMPAAVREPMLAYGFFLRGNYDESVKAWQRVSDNTHGADLHARAMLASSLDHLGKKADAQRINVIPFTPEFADLYSAISFTEMRRLLGR